ncbi:uncharacterized protein LOC104903575 isoform X1 [Beta vulgaris subsp. vulgaris]|uniref:uncharacterized protein LOC104903575 isoform X1 n=2 Tax=Beta vulgaris subsp. vulgaris TaxID=3555 RepID=UPI00254857D6|nr:uncharacterized protein LOC104903575 isoform X1 [Beta vulgaris subsp. vulgaris]XP_057247781.1 uncharacterized protein LOC104903575 isoform X1 [Beta vulgaris subsp. vulgaris]
MPRILLEAPNLTQFLLGAIHQPNPRRPILSSRRPSSRRRVSSRLWLSSWLVLLLRLATIVACRESISISSRQAKGCTAFSARSAIHGSGAWLGKLMSRRRNTIVAAGLVVFAAGGLAFPFYMALSSKKQPVIDSSKPLPPQATFRGPYINTGSRDVGPDHRSYPKND